MKAKIKRKAFLLLSLFETIKAFVLENNKKWSESFHQTVKIQSEIDNRAFDGAFQNQSTLISTG